MSKQGMERNLKARHITMLAIGGSIGTGLFMGSGAVVSQGGSYKAVLSYILIGVLIYFLMSALGEMASFYPVSGSISAYSERFVDSSLANAVGWLYYIMWILVAGIDVITMAKLLQFWEFFQQFSTVGMSIFFIIILYLINMLSVKVFGEVEFWLTIIKVLTVVVFIITGFALMFGLLGNKVHGLSTFISNGQGEGTSFLVFFGILAIAAFSFGGVEAVVITAGESEEPAKTMPKAVNQVFWRILIFYIATMFIISAVISINDPRLSGKSGILASPFTLVFEQAGLGIAAALMNAVIISSVFSAGNSCVYYASRQLYSLAENGYAPKIFNKLNSKSTPNRAVLITVVSVILCVFFEKYNKAGYGLLLSLVGILTICIWLVALYAHIRLRRAIKIQNKNEAEVLPYRAKFGVFGSYLSLVAFVLLIILQTYADFVSGGLMSAFYTILSVIILAVVYYVYKLMKGIKTIKLKDIDLSKYEK
ncbi:MULTISPECIES: amino acid permease [unclassified Gemella]|uniref:amino acid permease n=1 Tax=unclassified Gemella TaxID=2624949 RepID=UPI0015D03420|nr:MULTISPECIES: amino acid permease [unclassified Gemella]MBF0709825.1 amino acid permease [Gemella sp. GL1.1]NYS27169.1 amino acid permease [Gemella sp. GL1]